MRKNEKGITLIALIITIIVLIILAGIAITALTGENGIINKSNTSKIKTSHGSVRDQLKLLYGEYKIYLQTMDLEEDTTAMIYNKNIKLEKTMTVINNQSSMNNNANIYTFKMYCIENGYCDENGKIDVQKLTSKDTGYGKGTGTTDVYVLTDEVENNSNNNNEMLDFSKKTNLIESLQKCVVVYDVTASNLEEIKANYIWKLDYFDKNGTKENIHTSSEELTFPLMEPAQVMGGQANQTPQGVL